MTRVKICGITNLADAQLASELGADLLGFIFFAGSRRGIDCRMAREIIQELPASIERVGVFVNETPAVIAATVAECGLTAIQFHGDEPPAFCRQFAAKKIKAIRVRDAGSVRAAAEYDVDALLLDTYTAGQRGGTGQTFDWSLAVEAKTLGKPVILSGGLTPENVAEAIRQVQPDAVDVASGVEREPCRKNPEKLRRFIQNVRGAME